MEVDGRETGIDLQCLCQLPCTNISDEFVGEIEGVNWLSEPPRRIRCQATRAARILPCILDQRASDNSCVTPADFLEEGLEQSDVSSAAEVQLRTA